LRNAQGDESASAYSQKYSHRVAFPKSDQSIAVQLGQPVVECGSIEKSGCEIEVGCSELQKSPGIARGLIGFPVQSL
jgi:hypothetical protein